MDVLATLKQRLADAEDDAERIRKAIAILEADTAPRRAAGRRTAKPVDAQPRAVPLGKLLRWVAANPGSTTTTIAKQTGGDQSAILTLLKEAEQEGKVPA